MLGVVGDVADVLVAFASKMGTVPEGVPVLTAVQRVLSQHFGYDTLQPVHGRLLSLSQMKPPEWSWM
jgi:hypothetical protein